MARTGDEMPDFERLFDKMAVDLAETEEAKQYELGYVAGKKRARVEVLVVIVVVYFAIAAIGHMASA